MFVEHAILTVTYLTTPVLHYGQCCCNITSEDASVLDSHLHNAVKALLGSFPNNMKDDIANTADEDNASANNAFTANYKALKKALDLSNIESDWGLWFSLQSLQIILPSKSLQTKHVDNHPMLVQNYNYH